ncbi:MAG: UDP-N-acetylglucosamine 2-epimerase (non-hydrolyzing) [Polynucleobacter sp. 17-46-58]|jgi:UDP-GlcNAc3NAcA epimerase|nr:MAG: UDP-N-acetylglucosamine 2-epimerase (non-hydrolyzing) [Polynucleobacter sp. 17-46-58]OZB49705.1 MAG: UDP-N-acetylglucosamine 2-epimerase (non-hydrolyzing) [Polynucleobacter sp. 39-45-136]
MKILTVVGARPQFIKAAAVSRAIRDKYSNAIEEVILHTGQHYDPNMSQIFFDELDIPKPKFNLEISGGGHGAMTGKMLEGIEDVLLQEQPDCLLIYGDTNSTLAGAISASKLHIPIAHVEAGLRSFNMRMPEEINRILSDRISSFLFCPTKTAVENLQSEGISSGVYLVGDVMYDVALFYQERAKKNSRILQALGLDNKNYCLATCHRAENTEDPQKLKNILIAFSILAKDTPIVFPLHPRTKKFIVENNISYLLDSIITTAPLPFLDMIALEQAATMILTDSGGVQKEAFFYHTPCITLRDETEWVETVSLGWNQLAGANTEAIVAAAQRINMGANSIAKIHPYGNGNASSEICHYLLKDGN